MSHPCAECGKHRFGKPGVTCYWCRSKDGGVHKITNTSPGANADDRLTIDQLRSRLDPRNQR